MPNFRFDAFHAPPAMQNRHANFSFKIATLGHLNLYVASADGGISFAAAIIDEPEGCSAPTMRVRREPPRLPLMAASSCCRVDVVESSQNRN